MNCWIGTDEAGKGDYFGGIVIAGVLVDDKSIAELRKIGARDSKKLSENQIRKMGKEIQSACLNSVVEIGIEKYNELYVKMHNLNHLLAWGHARAIENLLSKQECGLAIADKFGDVSYIENALMKKGKQIQLIQKTKAEEDIAVAAASILAKNKFLENIEKLSSKYGMEFPRGASMVEEAACDFIKKYGSKRLNLVAKVHFKTTKSLPKEPLTTSLELPVDSKPSKNGTPSQGFSSPQNSAEPTKQTGPDKLWAPWRAEYIKTASKSDAVCVFCDAMEKNSFIIARQKNAFAILNIFPYNTGHIMVAPVRHTAKIEELSSEELSDMFTLLQQCISKIKSALNPDGFNVGMNIGKVAGAGVEHHLHIHIVPRWNGDTNFMPVIGNTKIISQSLEETYKLLKLENIS